MAVIEELNSDEYPVPVNKKSTNEILHQMENSVAKIFSKNGNRGTGFFCKLKTPEENEIYTFITNNHVIKEDNEIFIKIGEAKDLKKLDLKNKLKYKNEIQDIVIIEIKEEFKDLIYYMELDDNVINDYNCTFIKNSIYTIHYPYQNESDKVAVSYGVVKDKYAETDDFQHYCQTERGSSGAPILTTSNNKVIGIHKLKPVDTNFNIGLFLSKAVKIFIEKYNEQNKTIYYELETEKNIINSNKLKEEFKIKDSDKKQEIKKSKTLNLENKALNEIKLQLLVDEDNINKNIYFLDNTYKDGKPYHGYLKELNESNTKLYINKKEYKYNKYFIPKKEGIYSIVLKFTILMKDCSCMFFNCKNIISIDFSSFISSEVTSMNRMFLDCKNLKSLDLSKFDTKKVTNMECMFYRCDNLINLDISKFDTKNVKNMSCMFTGCLKLSEINISSFDFKNIQNVDGMFSFCMGMKKLKIKKELLCTIKKEIHNNVQIIYS